MPPEKRVRRPRQARSKATVAAILGGTAQVLRKEGLDGCTTSKIAERAGVSVGTLYQYFPNKEAVFEALIDRLLEERVATRAALLRAEPEGEEIGPAVASVVDSLLAVHLADPPLQRELHRYEAAAGFQRLDNYLGRMIEVGEEQLRRHAERFRPLDAPLAARILVHALSGVIERLAREEPESLEQPAVRREIAALMAGYLSPDNPLAR